MNDAPLASSDEALKRLLHAGARALLLSSLIHGLAIASPIRVAAAAPPSKPEPPDVQLPSIAAWPPPPPAVAIAPARAASEWAAVASLGQARLAVSEALALGPILQNPQHPSHLAAVARASALARELPDAAALERHFGAVDARSIAALGGEANAPVRSGAQLLLARHRHAVGAWADALAAYASVEERDPARPKALLALAGAHVRNRNSVPAVQALVAAHAALDGAAPSYERTYLRDLTSLSIARIYYSAAVRLDRTTCPRSINRSSAPP